MVKLEKYSAAIKLFVFLLTFCALNSCGSRYQVSKIEGREIGITESAGSDAKIEQYIKPYRDNIDKDLSTVLAYAPQTVDKIGTFQTPIGNLMADATLDFGNRVFSKREKKQLDMCLLNFGGIRSIIPKGNVTTKTAFEIMPFENSLVVAELKAEQIREIVNYIFADKKAHPISGLSFRVNTGMIENIRIKGQPLDDNKTYFVVTSDYLLNGGDKMDFFKKSLKNYDLDYKLRNVLIDYFKEVDTIPVIRDKRIEFSY
ncbi:MAG: hypothetical protein EOO48_04365 [Flavobacterium sp.]|nr:MAG: hypothetical protein EOO48_04365 [Flavobacterium sp.]